MLTQEQVQSPYTTPPPAGSYQYQQPQQVPPQQAQPQQIPPAQMPPAQMPSSQMPTSYTPPPPAGSYQYQQQPMQPQQMPYPAPQQPKKSRVGLIVGLSLGGVLLLAALIIGGVIVINNLIPATITPPEYLDIDPPQQTDPPEQTGSTSTVSGAETYTHDPIGISFMLADGWFVEESPNFPDEVLGIHTSTAKDTYVWIDRYPGIDAAYYTSDKDIMLGVYTGGLSGTVTEITLEEDIKVNGVSWHHVEFILTSSIESSSIDYYITDMPNNRGVFMYAIISPITSSNQTVFPGYDDAYDMFKSLRFTK